MSEQIGENQVGPLDIHVASYAEADAIIQMAPSPSREHFNYIQGCITARQCYTAILDGHVAGYAIMGNIFFGYAFISQIQVHPDFRRQGIAYRLGRFLEKQAQGEKLFISCQESNQPALHLFEKLGFVASGTVHNLNPCGQELIFYKKLH